MDTWNQPYTENLEKERSPVNAGNGDITQLLSQWVSDGVIAAMVAHPSTSPSPQPGEGQIGKDKVYISDSESWAASGGFTMSHGSGGGGFVGGSKPQTVELIKTFGQRCPSVLVTMDRIKADYVVLFDRESAKGYAMRRDKIAVFNKNGDVLYSGST
jgi:hypothetical protein